MSWVIWRQHRTHAAWVLLLVAGLCGLMLWVRARATADVADLRAAGCLLGDISGTGCQAPLDDFAVRHNFTILAFELGVPLVLAVTAALVGAPLVAREVEQRTQLVAWTQSVTRQRWYHSKVVTIGGGLSLAGLLAGTGTYLLQGPLSDGGVTSSRWPWFFSTPWPQPAAPPWRSPSPSPPGPGCDGPLPPSRSPGRVPGACSPRPAAPCNPHPGPPHPTGRPRRPPRRLDLAHRHRRRHPLPPGQPVLAAAAHLPRHPAHPHPGRARAGLARHPHPRRLNDRGERPQAQLHGRPRPPSKAPRP
jgi:hypothetical protein